MKLILIIASILLVSCTGMVSLTPSGCLEKDFLDSQGEKYYAGACFDESAYVRWTQADKTQVMMRRNPKGKIYFYHRADEKSKWQLMETNPTVPDGVEFPEPESVQPEDNRIL